MLRQQTKTPTPLQSGVSAPTASAEQWLGRNDSAKRRLWERLNPRHRKQLRVLARALVLRQAQGRLPEEARLRLRALVEEFERLMTRLDQFLKTILPRQQ
jgi:hypothetical protein